jgi:hypothetical protein
MVLPQGVRFNDWLFTEPMPLTEWKVPKYAGLFVILAKDPNWAPKPYQPLYFGEFGNNTPEALLSGNQMQLPHGEGDRTLLVSVLPMPFSSTAQRLALRSELLRAYNSAWQTDEVRAVSTGLINFPAGDPQSEPRRRIGFMP